MVFDSVVALFVRCPVPGRVKTRLAVHLGDVGACSLYRAMVTDILANIGATGIPLYLFHDGTESREVPMEWRDGTARTVAQIGGDIGERMAAAFRYCFAEKAERVILAGSDIPGLHAGLIHAADMALATHDVAIAPAADGGYCLIALRREANRSGFFQDIPWSTGEVLRRTLERCEEGNLKAALLDTLQDIDTIGDLAAYCKNPCAGAVATNTYLEKAGFI